jgi:pyruvate ferredoxin oxidoreductase gamma subunit
LIEVRIHGRGGQGAVTTAELLAQAAFFGGKQSQAFPSFGVERSGSPVESYCRIDEKPIRLHQQVYEPNYLIVLDDSLFASVDVCKGLNKTGAVIIATAKPASEFKKCFVGKVYAVDAYGIAAKVIGKPLVNTAMLGAFAKVTGLVSLENLEKAFAAKFPPEVAKKNSDAAEACFKQVSQ